MNNNKVSIATKPLVYSAFRYIENKVWNALAEYVDNAVPLFCLADLCKVLELTNPSEVKNRLDKDDVQLIDLHALNSSEGITGNSMANFVTESGFYDVMT